jgi:hypothetical protein
LDDSLAAAKAAAAYGKLYYTEGGPDLLAVRKRIAELSLKRAQIRLEMTRGLSEASVSLYRDFLDLYLLCK